MPPMQQELRTRVVSGVVLAVLALAALGLGGWVFAALAALTVAILFAEWTTMQRISGPFRLLGFVVIVGVVAAAQLGRPGLALIALALAVILGALGFSLSRATGGHSARWLAGGLLYAGLPGIALVWLRQQPDGLILVLWAMAIVWATDILAYFSGRRFGGPKLAPRISPKKTWAGLVGGMVGAGATSAALAAAFGWPGGLAVLALVGAVLAVVSQGGDLFESWLKRRAGVKDSGKLIPGHGGVMDRVDGLVPVSVVVAALVFATRLPEGFWMKCEGCSA